MTRFRFIVALAFSILVSSPVHAAEDYSKTTNGFKQSPVVQPFFKTAYGYALFPKIGKGGAGIGGSFGKGQVYRGGKVSGTTTMTQLTIGLQFGGQAYSQIIFFEDKRAYEDFTSGNFEFGAQASAVAITAGASAQTSSTGESASANVGDTGGVQKASYYKGMAVFTQAIGGLMYEAAIGGQKFSFKPL
jgi:lipid-binding SYLF domain-containing protein